MAKEKRAYPPRDVLLSLCAELLFSKDDDPDIKMMVVEALDQIGLDLPKGHEKEGEEDPLYHWLRDKQGAAELWADT